MLAQANNARTRGEVWGAAMSDKTRVETTRLFLQLSEALTGYSSADLLGTGLFETYYNEVRDIVGGRIFGRLLVTWDESSRSE